MFETEYESATAELRSNSERFSADSGYFYPVIPAQAGIQEFAAQGSLTNELGPGFRRDDASVLISTLVPRSGSRS
jgi:hypothetical protein